MNEIDTVDKKAAIPEYSELNVQYIQAYQLVDDIVLKNYITKLGSMEIIPLDESVKENNIGENVRFFKITEMIYQKDEYATYKFASVVNAVSNLGCSVFIIINSNGEKTEFYMGIRSLNSKRTTSSLKETLKNSLLGQFPGVKTEDYIDKNMREILEEIDGSSIAITSCVAKNKDEDITDNKSFLQGLEKLALSMQGQRYTGIIIANGTTSEQLQMVKRGYENIYTQLSPFAEMQTSYGTNEAYNISKAFSLAETKGRSYSKNTSKTTGTSDAHTVNDSITEDSKLTKGLGAVASIAPIIGGLLAPFTAGASLAVAGIVSGAAGFSGSLLEKSSTHGTSNAHNTTESDTVGQTYGDNESVNKTSTDTEGTTSGTSKNLQLTRKNKTILNILERIDLQLKRIKEFESLGMWECAAYFLSDNQYSAEIAASTYKAIMRGEDSGVEVSAVNTWGSYSGKKVEMLKDYIKNFIHPVFAYSTEQGIVPVNACSFVSGNELAIHIGLPRKSVSGFPVIEHTDFGKDILQYSGISNTGNIRLGKIYDMGIEQKQNVNLGRKSLTMHTFITGSTGSGKSNTVYQLLNEIKKSGAHFLVIEPAKGEYKNIFGAMSDVAVYGTNPSLTPVLRINAFRFPTGDSEPQKNIHILEHLDRLIEIFNVCWPMYAAMPAVLKEAIEASYEDAGWDLRLSVNHFSPAVYPSFIDVVKNIKKIIDSSEYSDENKGNYKGSLITRLKSLTNGINGMIFTHEELPNEELFDKNVIVDLSRVGSMETKALIMGLLVMKLQEYRMTSGNMNSDLRHITVLEEAHNLLKRTSTEQSSESSNLLGKSVEMLANAIAEMRTYGEGFIIADQAPGLLDMSVIRNTNTKIILRLPDQNDRELVGKAANLNDDQIIELSKLQCGVAAVYQNDWIQPVLCKIQEFRENNNDFHYQKTDTEAFNKANSIAELRHIALKNVKVENLKEKIEAIDSETFKNIDAKTITRLFKDSDIIFKQAMKTAAEQKTKLEGLYGCLVNNLEPSLNMLENNYRKHILNCIIEENCKNDVSLREVPELWDKFINKKETDRVGKLN
jgi:hypothetical protein